MRVVTTSLLAMLLLLPLGLPAAAGTADDPDLTDPCGQLAPTDTGYERPENDLCAAWFSADVSSDDVVLTATVRTLAPSRPGLRYVEVGWTVGACEYLLFADDGAASPRPVIIPVGEGGAVFPQAHPVGLRVSCVPAPEPCVQPVTSVICSSYEREATVELPADAVSWVGTDATIVLDPARIDLSGTPVAGEAIRPGDVLTDLHVTTATGPQHLVVPPGGALATAGSTTLVQFTVSDVGVGGSYVVPARDTAASG